MVCQSNYLWIALRKPIERRLHSIEIIASPRIYRNLLHQLRFINFVFDAEACQLASAELRFLVHFFALCESLVIYIKIMMEMKIKWAKS